MQNIQNLMVGSNEAIDKYALNKSFLRLDNILQHTYSHTITANTTSGDIPYATNTLYGLAKYSDKVIELTGNFSAGDYTILSPYLINTFLSSQNSVNYNTPTLCANYTIYTTSGVAEIIDANLDTSLYSEVYSGTINLLNGLNMSYGYRILSAEQDLIDLSLNYLSGYLSGQYNISIPSNTFTNIPIIYTQIIDNVVGEDDYKVEIYPKDRLLKYFISNINTTGFTCNLIYKCDKDIQWGPNMLVYPGFTLTWLAMGA